MLHTEKPNPYKPGRPTETHTRASQGGANLKPSSLFAWLASLATVSAMLVNLFLPRGDNSTLRGAGVLVVVLASVFIFAPFFLLRKHGGTEDGKTYMQTNTVVDQGLYALIRHPQYLGYVLLAGGFTLLSQHRLAFPLAVTAAACFYIQAVQEERHCLHRLGEPYEEYLQRVPRFNIVLGVVRLLRGSALTPS